MFLRYIIGSDRTLLDRLAGLGDITYLFLETHIPRTNNYFKKIIIITWNPQPFPLERRQPMGSFGILGPSAAGDATGFGILARQPLALSSFCLAAWPRPMTQPALFFLRRFVPADAVLDLVFEFVGARCTLCEQCTGRALLDGSRQWQWWCMDCALLVLDWEHYPRGSHTGWLALPMGSSTLASTLHMD